MIDDSSRGADGTRLADANGDGRLDIVTGWEQGGITRLYLNPGPESVSRRWPAVTVGPAESVEDAVLVDLDGDGALDVVSCCEGRRQVMLVHWAPSSGDYLDPKRWTTVEIPGSLNKFRWMYATAADIDADGKLEVLAGGKNANSELGWWKLPSDPRQVDHWQWIRLRPMGWLMSLEATDMDGDGDLDVLFTDRKSSRSGCYWMENPGDGSTTNWREHLIGLRGREAMFMSRSDWDGDGWEDLLVAEKPSRIAICRRLDRSGKRWQTFEIAVSQAYGGSKSAVAGDINGDSRPEIVFSTERASEGKMGVGQIVGAGDSFVGPWEFQTISGVDGVKHDLVELIDLDEDGDLDVLTCEEVKNLGVIWYENPRLSRR